MTAAESDPPPATLEVVISKPLPEVDGEAYRQLIQAAQPGFAELPGYLDLVHYSDAADQRFADLVWWRSRRDWQAAPERAMQHGALAAFLAATDLDGSTMHAYQRALPVLQPRAPTPQHVLEIAQFRLVDGTTTETYLDHARPVRALLAEWDGFLRLDTLHDAGSGEWVDLVCWRDRAAADAAMRRIQKEPAAAAWMRLIEPESLRMTHLTHRRGPQRWR